MTTKVIIFSTSTPFYRETRRRLAESDLPIMGYSVQQDALPVEILVKADEPQLLVLGYVDGSAKRTIEFAEQMKTKNRRLKVASFLLEPLSHPVFDFSVVRSVGQRSCESLIGEVRKFLSA